MNQAGDNMDALQQERVAQFVPLWTRSPVFTHIVSKLFLYHMLSSEDDYSDKVHIRVTGSKLWRDASQFASQEFPPQFAFTF